MTDSLGFLWAGETVPVRVRASRRAKRIYLRVLPPAQVEIVLPRGVGRRQLPAIIERNSDWLTRTRERMRTRHGATSPLTRPAHITLPAIGEEWPVHYSSGARAVCREKDGELVVRCGDTPQWQGLLIRWLANRARATLVPWLRETAAELNLPFGRVTIRGQRTRWGSCSSARNINLNYRLLFLPPEQVRYLFVHELSHTVHLNHSPAFWRLVESFEPDYRALDRAMRQAGRHVPAWALPL